MNNESTELLTTRSSRGMGRMHAHLLWVPWARRSYVIALAALFALMVLGGEPGRAAEGGPSDVSATGAASSTAGHPPVGFTVGYFESIPEDAWSIFSAPAHWSGDQWLEAGVVGAVGLVFYGFDTRIRTIDQDHRSATTDRYAKAIRPFGQQYIAIPLVAAVGGSFISDDPRLIRTALLGGESLAISLAGYAGLQLLTNRARPVTGEGKAHWGGPGFTHDHSYPSGEVTAAFSCATILADEWKDVPGIAPLSYGIAAAVGLERMNYNAHWVSDVFTAGVLGYVVSEAVEKLHPLTTTHLGRISIIPVLSNQEKALAVTWTF